MTADTLLSIAKSKATANRIAKALGANDLQKAINHLQAALVAIKKREAKKAATKKAAELKKLKVMMAKIELSAADVKKLMAIQPKRKAASKKTKRETGSRKANKVAPKYQLKVGKQTHKWTGRGRMPLVFKSHVESGGSLESCLIKKSK